MFSVSRPISDQRVEDLLCCGLESGPYGDFVIVRYEPEQLANECTYPHLEMPFKGGAVILQDKYGDSDELYRLDKETIQRGLNILAEKYPFHMASFLNENEDVITGTAFVQCCLLGDIVYG